MQYYTEKARPEAAEKGELIKWVKVINVHEGAKFLLEVLVKHVLRRKK